MADLTEHMKVISNELTRTTEIDTLDRVQMRTRLIFDMFYDDEESVPDQAIRDALTDLMHVAAERDVDFDAAVIQAASAFVQEQEEWGERDGSVPADDAEKEQ